jgi:uncharacterized protein
VTLIYLDTSAVVKLFIDEPETPNLRKWLVKQAEPRLVSSALLGVELIRVLSLMDPDMVGAAEQFLASDVDIVEVTPTVLSGATYVSPPRVRTLDAIHLTTALDLAEVLDVLLSYDKVLLDAARGHGLTVTSPGGS